MKLFSLFCILITFYSYSKTKSFAFPGIVYLDGVGSIYGVAAGVNNLIDNSTDVVALSSFGEAQVLATALSNFPIWGKNLLLDYSFAYANNFEYDTTYARGLQSRTIFRQRLRGKINRINFKYKLFHDRLALNYSMANSHVEFKNYYTSSGELIEFSNISLHDMNTNIKSFGVSLELIKPTDKNTAKAGFSIETQKGRLGQSDIRTTKYFISGSNSLSQNFQIAYNTQLSKAKVTNFYPGDSINGRCENIPELDKRTNCETLDSELSDFIANNNQYGMVAPLGGSQKMRAYRELRFRAANIAYYGLEGRYQFEFFIPLQFVTFFEQIFADDQFDDLFNKSLYSAGIGLRYSVGKIPVRLETAFGNEDQTVFLTAGLPW